MSNCRKVACIQNNASPNLQENLALCTEEVYKACDAGADFIALPEYFSGLKSIGVTTQPIAFAFENHPVIEHFQALARATDSDLLLGSVGVTTHNDKLYNRSVLLNRGGQIVGHYDKIHLFDVNLGVGHVFQESATIQAGKSAKVFQLGNMTIGMSICYDLRFPELYRHLAQSGATVLTIPAAFSHRTGRVHWQALLQARAIENGCFVIAPGQTGKVSGGGRNYGHSMIVSPWGEILCEADEETGIVIADIDLDQVAECRERIPSLNCQKEFSPAQRDH